MKLRAFSALHRLPSPRRADVPVRLGPLGVRTLTAALLFNSGVFATFWRYHETRP